MNDESLVSTVSYNGGNEEWRTSNRTYHRLDGPAFISYDGSKQWIVEGKTHREDGPAVEWANGINTWWLHNIEYENSTKWAAALLRTRHEPDDDEAVIKFLKPILQKQVQQLI